MFLNRLKELRQKNGVKQKDIASMLGVTAGAVSQWENGEARETEPEHESGCGKEGGQYA